MGEIGERSGRDPVDPEVEGAAAGANDGTPDPWASFDRWASNLFLVFAVLGLLVIVAIGGLGRNADGLLLALGVAIAAVAAALLLGTSIGLDRKRGWARAAASGLLVIMLVTGLVGAAADFMGGRLTIPLGSIIAALVLAKKPGPLPAMCARDGRVAVGVLGLYLVASPGGLPAWLLTAEASPLVADRAQLELAVASDCPADGLPAAGDAGSVNVIVSWSWRSRDLVPPGGDAVELSWGQPAVIAARLDEVRLPAGATIGGEGPGIRLLQQESGTSSIIGMGPGLLFGDTIVFSLGGQPAGDGRLEIPLDVQSPDGGIGFDLVARYAHGSAWTQIASTSCLVRAPAAGALP